MTTELIIVEEFFFLNEQLITTQEIDDFLENVYLETDEQISFDDVVCFLDNFAVELLCRRALVFDDINYGYVGGCSLKKDVLRFMEENPGADIQDFIYDMQLSIDGNNELFKTACTEMKIYMLKNKYNFHDVNERNIVTKRFHVNAKSVW